MTEFGWIIVYWVAAGLLGYALGGYPLLLLLLNRRGERKFDDDFELPPISLIIPAYNEASVIREKLENTLTIDYPRDKLEILVASDGSEDGTNEIALEFAEQGIRLLDFSPRRGKASVLNDATGMAAHDILCLCDANVMFRPDALRKLVRNFANEKIGAVTGDVQLASEESNFGSGESFYYRIERGLQLAESDIGSLMGVDGGMYLIRKQLFTILPGDTILDDFVVSIEVVRQGYGVVYEPDAIADESGTPTASQEYRRRKRVSAGAVQSLKRGVWPRWHQPIEVWQFLSHKVLRWACPLWLALLLVANAMLWNAGWFYQATLIGQLAIYLLALMGLVIVPARAFSPIGIPFYFMLSQVGLVAGMFRGIFNLQKVTWQPVDRSAGEDQKPEGAGG